MVDETETPKPEDSGTDGTQVKAEDASNDLVTAQPLGPPMATAITGLAASHSRAFGGEVASTLIAGATSQMSTELHHTKEELSALRTKAELLTNDLTTERIKSAVLSERLDAFRSTRHLKNVGVAIGTLLLGIGVQSVRNQDLAFGIVSALIGAVVVLISWLSAPKGGGQ